MLTTFGEVCFNENHSYCNSPIHMKNNLAPHSAAIQNLPASPAPRGPLYLSQSLFQGSNVIWIEHDGEHYSLRRTRQGKLILTK